MAAIQNVLAASPEPLTLPKIKTQLPVRFRGLNLEEILQRQAAAQVLHRYPKYRSQQDRFWDRPMAVHLEALVQAVLGEGPLDHLGAYGTAARRSTLRCRTRLCGRRWRPGRPAEGSAPLRRGHPTGERVT